SLIAVTRSKILSRFDDGPPDWLIIAFAVAVSAAIVIITAPLISSGMDWRERTSPIEGGAITTGRVVDVLVDQGNKGVTYRAVVEFVDVADQRHTLTNKAGDIEPRKGARVRISYDPSDPANAHDLTTGAGVWK